MHPYVKNLAYILKHKYYVFIECCKLGMPLRGIIHDFSKFSPSEFKPYAMYFFSENGKELYRQEFDKAWLHHHRSNKHHWEYWVEHMYLEVSEGFVFKPIKMPEKYMKEMLADWRGAGRAINGTDDTFGFYLKNKDKMILHHETREWIEQQLLKNN